MNKKEVAKIIADGDWWKETFAGSPLQLYGYTYRDGASFYVGANPTQSVNKELAMWIRKLRGLPCES